MARSLGRLYCVIYNKTYATLGSGLNINISLLSQSGVEDGTVSLGTDFEFTACRYNEPFNNTPPYVSWPMDGGEYIGYRPESSGNYWPRLCRSWALQWEVLTDPATLMYFSYDTADGTSTFYSVYQYDAGKTFTFEIWVEATTLLENFITGYNSHVMGLTTGFVE